MCSSTGSAPCIIDDAGASVLGGESVQVPEVRRQWAAICLQLVQLTGLDLDKILTRSVGTDLV